MQAVFNWPKLNVRLRSFPTCIATGKSVWASGGKNTSTAFFANGWFPVAGWPTSMMCNWKKRTRYRNDHSGIQLQQCQNKGRNHVLHSVRSCLHLRPISVSVKAIFSCNSSSFGAETKYTEIASWVEFLCTSQGPLHLSASLWAHSKAEEGGGFGISFHFELPEGSSMALDGLGHFPVNRIQLHCPNNTVLLQNKKQTFTQHNHVNSCHLLSCPLLVCEVWVNMLMCVFTPVQKSLSAAATSAVRQFCSWWSDIPPDWHADQILW